MISVVSLPDSFHAEVVGNDVLTEFEVDERNSPECKVKKKIVVVEKL
jgi:hypothetical protein